jgi:hypothetical protein
MEVGQGPNYGCSTEGKNGVIDVHFAAFIRKQNVGTLSFCPDMSFMKFHKYLALCSFKIAAL